jgi:hypothetical protein
MDMDLAAMYGTPGGEEYAEDFEKTAEADLFVKLAAENGIDLNQLDDEQISELWDYTFAKEAQEKKDEDDEDEEEEKKSAAELEFLEQQEFQEKVAEMDYLGRLMAHAYVQELGNIGDSMEKEAGKAKELAGKAWGAVKGAPGKAWGGAKKGGKAIDVRAQRLGEWMTRGKATKPWQKRLAGYGAPGAAAAAAGGGGYAAMRKKSSAIDELAMDRAVEKAAESGWDPEEAAHLVGALGTLGGIEESEKLAFADNTDEAIEIRASEYLEAAGYPVEW